MTATPKLPADWKNRHEDILTLLEGINNGHTNLSTFKTWLTMSGRSLTREYEPVQIANKLTEMKRWTPERRKQEIAKRILAQGKSAREAQKQVDDAVKMEQADVALETRFRGSHVNFDESDDEDFVPAPSPSRPPPAVTLVMSPPAAKKRSPPRPMAAENSDEEFPRLTRQSSFELHQPFITPESLPMVPKLDHLRDAAGYPSMFGYLWSHQERRSTLILHGLPETSVVRMTYDVDEVEKISFTLDISYCPSADVTSLFPAIRAEIPPVFFSISINWPTGVVPGVPLAKLKGKGIHLLRFESTLEPTPTNLVSRHSISL